MTGHVQRPMRFAFASLATIAFATALLALAGCGKKNESAENPSTTPATTPAESTMSAAPANTTTTAAAPPTTVAASNATDLGTRVFQQRCVLCHGPEGRGDGIGGKALNPHPRNFHDQAYMKTRTDAQLSEVIHNGKGAMPKWGGVLSEAEIQAVLKHVRELGKKP